MQVELNGVFQINNLDGLDDGLYRVLQLYSCLSAPKKLIKKP
jgi:hypothetical protein